MALELGTIVDEIKKKLSHAICERIAELRARFREETETLIGLEILLELFLSDPSSRRLHDQSPERKRQAPARGSRSRFGGTDFGADFAPGNRRFLSGGESDLTD